MSPENPGIVAARDYALAQAAKPFLGDWGFKLIAVGALFSTASAINATLFGGALSERGVVNADDEAGHPDRLHARELDRERVGPRPDVHEDEIAVLVGLADALDVGRLADEGDGRPGNKATRGVRDSAVDHAHRRLGDRRRRRDQRQDEKKAGGLAQAHHSTHGRLHIRFHGPRTS